MNDRLDESDPHERRLHDVVGAYLEAVDAGWAPDRQRLLHRYPDLADDLHAFFADQVRVASLAYPAPSPTPTDGSGEPAPSSLPTSNEHGGAAEPSSIGGYESLQLIKEGGMGSVFKAWQKNAERWVALKKIKVGRRASRADVRRFHDEAAAAANLRHPNIVKIYDVGEHDGQPFFSMELFEHGSLQQHLPRFQNDPRAAVRLLSAVARAVHYAHQHGILHRDLKPANILLDAQEQPYVADFGLAKRLRRPAPAPRANNATDAPASLADTSRGKEATPNSATVGELEDVNYLAPEQAGKTPAQPSASKTDENTVSEDAGSHSRTREGAFVGTQGYAAPEHATISKDDTSTAADIYSLGAILYKMMTGKTLFQATTLADAIRLVREHAPEPPRTVNPQADARLEAVCLKCLAKDPQDRYASAEALADDLDRWLMGEPPLAWPLPWRLRAWRALRRNLLVGTLATLLGLATATAFFVYYYLDPDRAPRALNRKAKQGRLVLIDEIGHPRWWRWNAGEAAAVVTTETGKPFSFATFEYARMELLQKPPGPRYRFSVDVRHDRAIDLSWVGIYFAHSQKITEEGIKHYWWDMSFADSGTTAQQRKGPDPKHKYSEVTLVPRRFGRPEGTFRQLNDKGKLFLSALELKKAPDWRQLAVEVTPEKIRLSWENEVFRELTPAEVRELGEPFIPKGKVIFPEIEFDPNGGIGIYVYRGKASFRNAIITPLE